MPNLESGAVGVFPAAPLGLFHWRCDAFQEVCIVGGQGVEVYMGADLFAEES